MASLIAALAGDVMLDLGPDWLIPATVPFLGSTLLLAFAFHLRLGGGFGRQAGKELALLAPVAAAALALFAAMAPGLADAAPVGAVLLALSVLLLWRALAALLFNTAPEDARWRRRAGLAGACGIVANYVLYAVDLSVRPVPRDLVIQVYYWGQAFAAWSFLLYSPAQKRRTQDRRETPA